MIHKRCSMMGDSFSSVQSLSRVRLFATPWTAARQASLSITNSQSPLKLMPIESVMPSSHLILCGALLLPPQCWFLTSPIKYLLALFQMFSDGSMNYTACFDQLPTRYIRYFIFIKSSSFSAVCSSIILNSFSFYLFKEFLFFIISSSINLLIDI